MRNARCKRLLGLLQPLQRLRPKPVLAHDAETSAEASPGRRIRRIGLDRALIRLDGARPLRGARAQTVRAQVVRVGLGARRHVAPEQPLLAARERQRERLDDRRAHRVLDLEHVVDRDLGGVRPQHRTRRHFHQLHADAHEPLDWRSDPVTTASTPASLASARRSAGLSRTATPRGSNGRPATRDRRARP